MIGRSSGERDRLLAGIAALEAQRSVLGDAVVDSLLGAARDRLAALDAVPPSADPPAQQQRLRQVAILLLDVVGSTTLSQHLDAEDTGAVMDDALVRAAAVISAHDGRTINRAGDSVLGAFGIDGSREDDSERAVRCGLALRELGRTIAAEVDARHGHAGFGLRIGVHTGGVLVSPDGALHGLAVNVAARMEQSAPPNGLRISAEAYGHVRGLFDVDAEESFAVKGVDAPVRSHVVVRAKPRAFRLARRGIEGVATRMVGRAAELDVLQAAFRSIDATRTLAAVTIVAEAGLGKSRLLDEFSAWAEARPESFLIFRGRATPRTEGQPFGLLRDVLAWRFQIADDDTLEAARAKIEAGVVPLFADDEGPERAESHAHLLGHLVGIDWRESPHVRGIAGDARQLRNRAFHTAAQLLRRMSARTGHPVVLELEDLHWADSDSLDLVAYLAEVDRDVPLLIVACARPALYERRPSWGAHAAHRRLDLAPLDPGHSRDLADELLQKLADVPAALRELLTGGAEGNPFYMEELVRMLIDERAISTGDDWTVDIARLIVTRVPSTLTGVLQARLDSLPESERRTLQEASVIGPVFSDSALMALEPEAATTLPALVSRELAVPRTDSGVDGLHEYAFKHAILHQVTYGTLLKRIRRELHRRLAQWYAGQTGLRANDFLADAAMHFEEAGDAATAAEFHARAAEHAQPRMAHDAVRLHVARAMALMERIEAQSPTTDFRLLRWRLLKAREATLGVQGDRPAQRADIEALEALADSLADDDHRTHAAWLRCDLARSIGDFPATEAAAHRLIACAERAGAIEMHLWGQRMLALALIFQGDVAGGRALAETTLAAARERGLPKLEGACANTLGVSAAVVGDQVGFLDWAQESLVSYRAAGDRRAEGISQSNVGVGWVSFGELDRGVRELEEALRVVRSNGDRAAEPSVLRALSVAALWRGDDALALTLARTAVDTALAVEARDWIANALVHLGNAELALGRRAEARAAFARSLAIAAEIGHDARFEATAGLARVALAEGDATGAVRTLASVFDLGGEVERSIDGTDFPRLIELTCHRALAAAGDPRAAHWLERANAQMLKTARSITDPALRRAFLTNIPIHREIAALAAGRSAATATGERAATG